MDRKEINLISELANIRIREDEIEEFIQDFTRILSYFGEIIDIPFYKRDLREDEHTPLREDKPDKRATIRKEEEYYSVPRII